LASPITFFKGVGDTFTLEIKYKLEVDGVAPGAVSIAEVTGSAVHVFATVVPEPGGIVLASLAVLSFAVSSRCLRRLLPWGTSVLSSGTRPGRSCCASPS
jgi:hypothetical protein